MYLFKSPLRPNINPETVQKLSAGLYIDNIFRNNRFPIGTRPSNTIVPLDFLSNSFLPNEFKGSGIAPYDNLRRYRNESLIPLYREPVENLLYNTVKTKIQKLTRINSPVIKWGSINPFKLNLISNSIYDASKDLYIVKNGLISFSGYTHNNQNLKVQYLESGIVLHNFQADKFTGEFFTSFNIPEGRANFAVVSYGSGLPTEVKYINIKLDTTITDSIIDFEEVVPTDQITKSELQTTKLTGTIEEESSITKIQISDGSYVLNVPTSNVSINASWHYVITIPDLSALKDGNITAYITIVDKVGNSAIISSNIELFKFAFSPIVMFI